MAVTTIEQDTDAPEPSPSRGQTAYPWSRALLTIDPTMTALAAKSPYLWVAGAGGLRRVDVTTSDWETVGEVNDTRTRAVTAIAIDDDGAAWVAGAMGIGRWVAAGDDLRYEAKGTPGTVTALAARRPVATEGIWAGGPGGLYRYDGRIFPGVEGLRDVPVSSIVLDDDGKGAWVGTQSHGLYHAEGDHAAPVPGGPWPARDRAG